MFLEGRLMAHPSDPRLCSPGLLRCGFFLVSLFLVVYIVRRPIFWHLRDNSYAQSSCPPCDCDCDSDSILSTPLGFLNGSHSGQSICLKHVFSSGPYPVNLGTIPTLRLAGFKFNCQNGYDCGKNDPDTNEEMEKDAISLLSEELSLLKNVIDDNLERTKALVMDAKRASSHYQKEAEKCNAGMETCEEAREKAEAALIEERKLSALWEKRAREYGWSNERRLYS